MAMGVLLRRNHRRVAANMTEPSAGLPACLVCLSVYLSVSLVGHCTAVGIQKRLERFKGGGNWSSVWVGPREGNCDLQPQTGSQEVERNKRTSVPT